MSRLEKIINFVGKNIDRIAEINGEQMRLVGVEKYGDSFNYLFLPTKQTRSSKIAKLQNDDYFRYSGSLYIPFLPFSNKHKEQFYAENGSPKAKKIVLIESPFDYGHNEYLLKLGEKYQNKFIQINNKTGKLITIAPNENDEMTLILQTIDGQLHYCYEPILPFYLFEENRVKMSDIKDIIK
jgi:hypothetical protein